MLLLLVIVCLYHSIFAPRSTTWCVVCFSPFSFSGVSLNCLVNSACIILPSNLRISNWMMFIVDSL